MTASHQQRAADIQKAIRDVLFYDWDPIDVSQGGPHDEYDSYVGPIYRLLASNPSRESVAETLYDIERNSMGLGEIDNVPPRLLLPVADKLLAIDIRLT
jgi:hypothetical protein